MLLPVDDDSRDLLIHEDEDGGEQGGGNGGRDGPYGVLERVDNPATIATGRLWRNK